MRIIENPELGRTKEMDNGCDGLEDSLEEYTMKEHCKEQGGDFEPERLMDPQRRNMK